MQMTDIATASELVKELNVLNRAIVNCMEGVERKYPIRITVCGRASAEIKLPADHLLTIIQSRRTDVISQLTELGIQDAA